MFTVALVLYLLGYIQTLLLWMEGNVVLGIDDGLSWGDMVIGLLWPLMMSVSIILTIWDFLTGASK